MIIKNNNLISSNISGIKPSQNTKSISSASTKDESSFGNILKDKLSETSDVKFSKHAELRLKSRNIELTNAQKQKLNEAVSKAAGKGIKDSLVMFDNMAFVVSVKNKTVVTALNGNELKDNVFTNIDGAVIV